MAIDLLADPVSKKSTGIDLLADTPTSAPSKGILQNVVNAIEPIGNFAAGFDQSLVNLPSNAFNAGVGLHNQIAPLVNKNATPWTAHAPTADFAPKDSTASTLGEIASIFAAPEAIGGVIGTAGKLPGVTNALSKLEEFATHSPRLINLLKSSALGAAYSPNNPLLGIGLGAAPAALGAAGRALGIPQYFSGVLSPDKIAKNLQAAKGTLTNLGDVLGSPALKKGYESILANVPFSGTLNSLQNVGEYINTKGKNIINKLSGGISPEELSGHINSALQKVGREQKEIKSNLYKDVDQEAQNQGFSPTLKNFSDTVSKYKDVLLNSDLLNLHPGIKKLISHLGETQKSLNRESPIIQSLIDDMKSSGVSEKYIKQITEKYKNSLGTQEKQPISLKEANIHKSELRAQAQKYSSPTATATEKQIGNIFGELGDSLSQDIRGSLEKHGSDVLSNKYKLAESNYAKNYSPLLDKDIYPFLQPGRADPDTLMSHFIVGGKNDRSHLLSKLTSLLPENARNALGANYLARAYENNGELNSPKMMTLIKNLGPKQLKSLFPNDATRDEILSHARLGKMNPEAMSIMENPKTGARNANPMNTLLGLIGAGFAGGGHLGAVALPAAAMTGGKIINQIMTSPFIREKVANAIIKSRQGVQSAPSNKLSNALIGAGAGLQNNNQ